MQMVSFRKNIRFLYILFLLVFLYIAHQSVQNKHAHFYANGVIVHSHPLKKNNENPDKNHNHSNAEICLYHLLNFEYFTPAVELHIDADPTSFPRIKFPIKELSRYGVWLYNTDTRDPPLN